MRVKVSARFVTDDELVADLIRVATLHESDVLTRQQYDRDGSYHSTTVHRRLGGWAAACARAGLRAGRPDLGHTDDQWMANIFEVWSAIGRQPSYGDMRGSRFSPEGYAKRFGSWTAALLKFQTWIDTAESTLDSDASAVPPASSLRETGRNPSLRLRFKVLQRDRFTCRGCGRSPATSVDTILHVDHIVPFSRGGETVLENLQALCGECNLGKSDL
jgi:hypothetical protein